MKIKNLIFGTLLILVSVLPAQASQVYFENEWQPASVNNINLIDITFNDVVYTDSIATQFALFFDMNENKVYDPSTDYGTYAYCVDFNTALYYDTSYNYDFGYNINNLEYAAWLFDTYWVDPSISSETYYTTSELEAMAALQLAIWEVIYDYNDNTNIFHYDSNSTTANVNTLYGNYMAALSTASLSDLDATYAVMGLVAVDNGTVGQTILVRNPVPEPGTFMLFGAGIVCISAIARRKRL